MCKNKSCYQVSHTSLISEGNKYMQTLIKGSKSFKKDGYSENMTEENMLYDLC